MTAKHPNRYGVMAMVSEQDYDKFKPYRELLEPHTKFFMEKTFVDGIAPQHISLCYFSYEEKYPEAIVESFIPKLKRILNRPIKIEVKGLKGWWELGWDHPVVCWNILDLDLVRKLHIQIIELLKEDVEHFNDPDLTFDPHIGVAFLPDANVDIVKKIVEETKSDPVQTINLDSVYIYFPSGPRKVIDLSE